MQAMRAPFLRPSAAAYPPTFARSTVTEALGSTIVELPEGSVFVTGGKFGSSRLSRPSGFHMPRNLRREMPVRFMRTGKYNGMRSKNSEAWALLDFAQHRLGLHAPDQKTNFTANWICLGAYAALGFMKFPGRE
jgi:hypothetical protein